MTSLSMGGPSYNEFIYKWFKFLIDAIQHLEYVFDPLSFHMHEPATLGIVLQHISELISTCIFI